MSNEQTAIAVLPTTDFGVPAPLGSEAMLSSNESYSQIAAKLQAMIDSKALPKGITSPMQAAIMIQHGAKYGLTALEALQSVEMVTGQPSIKARAMGELILRHYGPDAFRIVDLTDEQCVIECRPPGTDEVKLLTYTMAMAKKAGLAGKEMWIKFPAEMLRAKSIRNMKNTYFPALGMLQETEILRDAEAQQRRGRGKVTLKDLA